MSIACTIAVAAAGPSLMEPALPGAAAQPPWTLDLRLDPYLAVALTAVGLAAGTLGLALTLRAMRLGWTIRPRYVLLAGVIAAVVAGATGPFGTSDFLSYAAYGRELVTGHNPYLMAPQALARLGDPVARAVQDWAATPSVYGALASGVFGLASLIGGTSVRLTVFVLDLLNASAFAATGLLLDRLVRGTGSPHAGGSSPGSERRRLRAAVLWTCNPLLLQVLVAGSHVDGLAAVCCIGGIAVLAPVIPNGSAGSRPARRALAAGAILGLGFAVKPTVLLVFVGVGVMCARDMSPFSVAIATLTRNKPATRTVGGLVAGFVAVAAVNVALIGRAGVAQSLRASGMVSAGSPWRVVRTLLRVTVMSESAANDVVRMLAVVLAVALATALLGPRLGLQPRLGRLPRPRPPLGLGRLPRPRAGLRPRLRPQLRNQRRSNDLDCAIEAAVDGGLRAAAVDAGRRAAAVDGGLREAAVEAWGWGAFGLVLAWLVAWPYVLPWYDSLGWALLPLFPASGLDWLLLARTAALAFGYLPARSTGITIPGGLRWMEPVVRSGLTPAVLAVLTVLLVIGVRRRTGLARPSRRAAGLADANQA